MSFFAAFESYYVKEEEILNGVFIKSKRNDNQINPTKENKMG